MPLATPRSGAGARLVGVVLSTVGLLAIVFIGVRAVPGDPAAVLLGERATEADRTALRRRMHLDGTLWQQASATLADITDGSLGTSYALRGRPIAVRALLLEVAPATIALALASLLVAVAIALPLGSLAAGCRGRLPDHLGRAAAVVAMSTPVFVSGPVALWLLAVELPLAPTPAHPPDALAELLLPAWVVGFALAGRLARLLRATLLDLVDGPLHQALRARGYGPGRIWLRHLLPNALLPVLAVLGGQLGALLGGAIVTESIFGRPGLGTLLLDAIAARDPAVVQGCVLIIAIGYAATLAVVDAVVSVADPRTRQRADQVAA